jgi:hypothetical protein
MMLKKKERNKLLAITLAGTAAYFVKSWPLGDTILGTLIGASFGHPVLGGLAGAVVPSRKTGKSWGLGDLLGTPKVTQAMMDRQDAALAAAEADAVATAPNGAVTAGT